MTHSSTDELRKWIDDFCAELVWLRDLATKKGHAAAFERLVEAAAAGRADAAWQREMWDLLRRLSVPAGPADRGWLGDATVAGLPGLGEGQPSMDWYGCPGRICSRRAVRHPGEGVPRCALFDVELPIARGRR